MNLVDELLKKKGLKYSDLSPEERESYNTLIDLARKSKLTLDGLKKSVINLREIVQRELVDEPEYVRVFIFKVENQKNVYLKARLKNYLLIESILTAPEKAKAMIEDTIKASLPDDKE